MSAVKTSTTVQAPIETVFQVAADFPNAPERISGIKRVEMLTSGPIGVGAKFRETREFMKKEATEEMEVTGFDPPRSYTLTCLSHGCKFVSTFLFEPEAGGTKMTLEFLSAPQTFAAKLMAPLAWLMHGMVKKCIEQDMADIKVAAEKAAKG